MTHHERLGASHRRGVHLFGGDGDRGTDRSMAQKPPTTPDKGSQTTPDGSSGATQPGAALPGQRSPESTAPVIPATGPTVPGIGPSGSPPAEPTTSRENKSTDADYLNEARAGRAGGPTIEEFVREGYAPESYPPKGYAEVPSDSLRIYRATGRMPEPGMLGPVARTEFDDGSEYLIARSKNASFRRGGQQFTREWRAIPASDLSDAQLAAIENEEMIDSHRGDADEAAQYGQSDDLAGLTSDQLKEMLRAERTQREGMERQLERLSRGDRAPRDGKMPDGTPIR